MRKKRNTSLNVSHLFVLKHSSGPKIFQKTASSSFSEAVVGFKVGSDGYKNCWPELAKDVKFSRYRDTRESDDNCDTAATAVQLQCDLQSLSLDGQSHQTSVRPSQDSRGDVLLTTRYPRPIRPKRADPIQIDIEAAIQINLTKRRKRVKRLNERRCNPAPSCSGGNPLDSTNPVRKKGKVRESRKRKLTSLRKNMMKLSIAPQNEGVTEAALRRQLDGAVISEEHLRNLNRANIYSSKFREYCRNFSSPELVAVVKELLVTLRGFQERLYRRDQVKARARRRYALGFHECCKLLKAAAFKIVIMATNIERNGALLEKVDEVVDECRRQGVPVIFAGTCNDLSYSLLKKNRTCIVGIVNFDGANEIVDKMMLLFERDRAEYETTLGSIVQGEKSELQTDDIEETLRRSMLQKLRTSSTMPTT